jgi:hypothetical protein
MDEPALLLLAMEREATEPALLAALKAAAASSERTWGDLYFRNFVFVSYNEVTECTAVSLCIPHTRGSVQELP